MLPQRPLQHKRKISQLQLFHPSINFVGKNSQEKKPKNKNNHQKKSKDSKKAKPSNVQQKRNTKTILKIMENSSRRTGKKQTVIEEINYSPWGDQNCDCSNGSTRYVDFSEQNGESFFLFGRRSRSSINKEQKSNYNSVPLNNIVSSYYPNMEQIVQVPDTMSNDRRYENSSNSKFYQFTTMMQKQHNSLKKSDDHYESIQKLQKDLASSSILNEKTFFEKNDSLIQFQSNSRNDCNMTIKNLKSRKQKVHKNVSIETSNIDKLKVLDFSDLTKSNNKTKLFFLNNQKLKKQSKSKDYLGNFQKERSKQSLLFNNQSNHTLTHSTLSKKKHLSLKNESKLKIFQQKPKSFDKQKNISSYQTTHSTTNESHSKRTQSLKRLNQSITNNPKAKKLNIEGKNPNIADKNSNFEDKNLNLGQKIQLIEQSQSKLQSQYKILWECVGQLWENSQIIRYISQKNKCDIMRLKQQEKKQEEDVLRLKGQILASISSARY